MQLHILNADENMCVDLAKVKHCVWQTTYQNIYPDKKLQNFDFNYHANKFKDMINSKDIQLYVAMIYNKIVGYTAVGKSPRRQNSAFVELILLYVLQEYQGQGIGKALFKFAKEKLYKSNSNNFIIYCNKYNYDSQKFYLKMGCEIIETDPDNIDKSIPQIKFRYNFD